MKLRTWFFTYRFHFLTLWFMRHNDVKCDRSHRWIEGQSGQLSMRVTSHIGSGRAVSFELLPKGASPTV